ncbi:hypothetical protein RND81_05G191500 [Saponaria officinalis]|uniref:DUF309 domain-containing protein n=1 Tax=Saponaria officinalis TaxID=3572 RepID=A0AAW1KTV9_SAPOF
MMSLYHQLSLYHNRISTLSYHHNPHIHSTSLCFTKHNTHKVTRGDTHLSKGRRSSFFKEEEHPSNDAGYDSRLSMFEEAVKMFNQREYYACHDLLESMWYESNDPLRTLLHALLQCSVAFHHLFNQNHKGAMMEMGEGICKLRKLNFEGGPFHEFEKQISGVLNFIYQTQLELAACNEDFCVAMEQNERSYQLLEGFGAGQRLYLLEQSNEGNMEADVTYIVFDPQASYAATGLPKTRVILPTLEVTRDHLMAYES